MGARGVTRSGRWTVAVLIALAALPGAASARVEKAESVLPPGQSGFVSIPGLVDGTGSPHLTDQISLFERFQYKPAEFGQPGDVERPRDGVKITRDSFGVPRVDGEGDYEAWYGVGYAVAQDRLFQLELFKRATSGRLAEILGRDFLDDDVVARRDFYTDAEVDDQLERIPAKLQRRTEAYRDGINAWIQKVRTTEADMMPGEFAALGTQPQDWTVRDSARVGIFLARTVPSGDGAELENAEAFERIGGRAFDELLPVRSPGRLPTIPAEEGTFPSQPGRTADDEERGFDRSRKLVHDLEGFPEDNEGTLGGPPSGGRLFGEPGGSFMWAIQGSGQSFLFNGPQLGFSIPELFVEFELHSPEQDIRGVSAAGVPLVGIGHNGHVGWGFTSGLSDEDDLYAEELTGDETYRFDGEQREMDCRDEQFVAREAPTGLPGLVENPGAPAGARNVRICRTVHGPVQERQGDQAYARRYAIWGRELETFEGLTELNDSRSIGDVDRAMRHVTWNENVVAADSRGSIGYWHPGLHPLRPLRHDERLPYPGTGEAEWRGFLPGGDTPHVINPEQGWLTQWNNVPSIGWTNGDGPARERLAGNLHRVRILEDLVSEVAEDPSYSRSRGITRTSGTTAQQFPFYKDRLGDVRSDASGRAEDALAELLRWDGDYDRARSDGTVDPGVATWEELKDRAEKIALRDLGGEDARLLSGEPGSSHQFDISNAESYALRNLSRTKLVNAADDAARRLSERFNSSDPSDWREDRRMYEVMAMGAAQSPDLEFFDRGTWEQSLRVVGVGR